MKKQPPTLDILDNELMMAVFGDEPVSSTIFNNVFIPSNRIPIEFLKEMSEDIDKLEAKLLSEAPLFSAYVQKPYWAPNKRLLIEVFGNVSLSKDRHLMDTIIANGTMLHYAHEYTLRQATEALKLDVHWPYFNNQSRIDEPLLNIGVYYHIPMPTVAKMLSKKLTKPFRKTTLESLNRLQRMTLRVTPEVDGELIRHKSNDINLIRESPTLLCDMHKLKNNSHTPDTFTDLIINVSSFYVKSLSDDGVISRKRMANSYPKLCGPNGIEDFYKMLDSHKRSYIHNKFLSKMIEQYLDDKLCTSGINKSYKTKQLFKQVLEDAPKLKEHFSFNLVAMHSEPLVSNTFPEHRIVFFGDEK